MSVEMVRFDSDGLIVAGDCRIQPSALVQQHAAPVVGDCSVGVERDRSIETGEGSIQLPELPEHEAEIAMSYRVIGLDRDGPVEILNRLLQIAGLAGQHAHSGERMKLIGLGVEYLQVDLAGGRELSLLMQHLCLCKLLLQSCAGEILHICFLRYAPANIDRRGQNVQARCRAAVPRAETRRSDAQGVLILANGDGDQTPQLRYA